MVQRRAAGQGSAPGQRPPRPATPRPVNPSVTRLGGRLFRQHLGLIDDLIDVADHVEGGLGQVVVLAGQDLGEAVNGLLQGDELAGETCERERSG